MQLEEWLEKDIINFLEQRMMKKKDTSFEREDDYGLYLTKDYLKELEKLLGKDEITESEKLFDELKEHYNSLPKEGLEARKVYSILEIMYSKINHYLKLKGDDKGIRTLREILASRRQFSEVAFTIGAIPIGGNIEKKLENIDTKISRFGDDVHQPKTNLISKQLAEFEAAHKSELEKIPQKSDEEMHGLRAPTNNVMIPAANMMETPVFEPRTLSRPVPKSVLKPALSPEPRHIIQEIKPRPSPPPAPKPPTPEPPEPTVEIKPSVIPIIISRKIEVPRPEERPPVDTTPVDTTPVDTTPVDTTPVDTTPVDTTPVDTTPVDTPTLRNPLHEVENGVEKAFQDETSEDIDIMPKVGRESKMILIPRSAIPIVDDKNVEKKNVATKNIMPQNVAPIKPPTMERTPQPARSESIQQSSARRPSFYIPGISENVPTTDHGTIGFDSGMMSARPRISRGSTTSAGVVNPIVPMKQVNTSDTNESLYNEGLKLMYAGRYSEASHAFSKLLERNPKNKKAAIRLQQCLGGK